MTDEPPKTPPKQPDGPPQPQQQPRAPQASIQLQGAPLPPQLLAQLLANAPAAHPPPAGLQLMLPGIVQQSQMWQGPYPPPEAVERYEAVLPGTLNRLISMAENLQAAQIQQSADALQHAQSDTRRGHWLGFATAVFSMIGAVVTAKETPWLAAFFLSVPVMAVAKALVETTKAPTQADLIKAAAEAQTAPLEAPQQPDNPKQT